MSAAHLRLVPPRRESVIVDLDCGRPRFTCPWSLADLDAMHRAPVPHAVVLGMYLAAWARGEHCPLNIVAGRLEPHCRYEPSDDLWQAFGQGQGNAVGALGFGVPVMRDEREHAWAASWPFRWEWS